MHPAPAPAARDHTKAGGRGPLTVHAKSTGASPIASAILDDTDAEHVTAVVHRRHVTRWARRLHTHSDGMDTHRVLLLALLLVVIGVPPWHAPAAHANPPGPLQPPVPGVVVSGFEQPSHRYGAGHRGVDLASSVGEPVLAAADGVVSFSGRVAGRWSVSVLHSGGLRTTYTPVRGRHPVGTAVRPGDVLGHLAPGSHCASACLHWGLTDGDDYFDPLPQLRQRRVALVPLGSSPVPVPTLQWSDSTAATHPVQGRVTSRFGMRRHPLTGVLKLHDGLDIAAACGAPVGSLWPGIVTRSDFHAAYGHRVEVSHSDGRRSVYAHLRRPGARHGSVVAAGEKVGEVGSTGLSTGCHLHLMIRRRGELLDPASVLADG